MCQPVIVRRVARRLIQPVCPFGRPGRRTCSHSAPVGTGSVPEDREHGPVFGDRSPRGDQLERRESLRQALDIAACGPSRITSSWVCCTAARALPDGAAVAGLVDSARRARQGRRRVSRRSNVGRTAEPCRSRSHRAINRSGRSDGGAAWHGRGSASLPSRLPSSLPSLRWRLLPCCRRIGAGGRGGGAGTRGGRACSGGRARSGGRGRRRGRRRVVVVAVVVAASCSWRQQLRRTA